MVAPMSRAVFLLAALVVALFSPSAAEASPCDRYRNQGYCYVWVPSAGRNATAGIVAAILGSSFGRPGDVVVVVGRYGDGSIGASTPYGFAYGVWDGRGNIVFQNGIRCYGVASASVMVGRPVDYGFCHP